MAKQIVKFSCGHEVEMNLVGKMEKRQSYAAWAEREGVCHCCKNKKDDKMDAANKIKADVLNMAQDFLNKAPESKKEAFTKQIEIFKDVAEKKDDIFWKSFVGSDFKMAFNEIGRAVAEIVKSQKN